MPNRCRSRLAVSNAALLLALGPMLATEPAQASTVTITFETGAYDPDIVYPGGNLHGPYDWLEADARAAGFWAFDVGTPGGAFQLGHTHIATNYVEGVPGQAEFQHAWTNDLQGLHISMQDGSTFDVVSVSYRISKLESSDPDEQRLDWSWDASDPQLLVASDFDPSQPDFESPWAAYPIEGFDESPKPWIAQPIDGLNDVDGFYLTSTAGRVLLDNIVLEVGPGGSTVPEPSTALLASTGLVVLAIKKRRVRAARATRP